MLFSKLEMKR